MRLRNGTVICSFFEWNLMKTEPFHHSNVGVSMVRSRDDGKSWEQRPIPVDVPKEAYEGAYAMEPLIELPDGQLLLALYGTKVFRSVDEGLYASFVMRSRDGGRTWGDLRTIGADPFGNVSFEEPTVCLTKSGKLLAVMRNTQSGYLWQCHSLDAGVTWSLPKRLDLWGYPAHVLQLADGRLLATYGFRRPPWGVRACLSEDDGETWNLREEIIIRCDGHCRDLGYPSSVELTPGEVFTAYYFHIGDVNDKYNYHKMRYIAGSIYRP